MEQFTELSLSNWLLLVRALVNVAVAFSILNLGILLRRNSRSSLANPLMVMFTCMAVEIFLVTGGLVLPTDQRHIVAILARVVEGLGIAWFFLRISSKNGKHAANDPEEEE